MSKIKYFSKDRISTTLLESIVNTRYKNPDKLKKFIFEAVGKKITLTEAIKGSLSKMVDDMTFFFRNTVENSKRLDYLLNVGRKILPLGGFEGAPAINQAIGAILKTPPKGDRLKEFIRLTMGYLVNNYPDKSPILTFGAELSKLRNSIHALKSNKSLQGEAGNIDHILEDGGLLTVLNGMYARLGEEADNLGELDEPTTEDNGADGDSAFNDPHELGSSIEHDRFGDRKIVRDANAPDHTKDFMQYQERFQPPTKKNRSAIHESICSAFLAVLATNS